MASMRFTEEQQKVIDTRGRNLLVSAAAGSGKTAVLVERIIRMVTDKKDPIPVSDLLVVTFTNAAAAEMRERISNALYKEIENNPSNPYLQQQLTLMPSANIMTLHAFCMRVLKNHFYQIDLDPGFSIGNEADLTLMRQEVMEEVIESFYEEGDMNFIELIEGYASGKSDKAIEDLVMGIYRMSQSHPAPEQWLNESLNKIKFTSLNQWFGSEYVAYMRDEIKIETDHLSRLCDETLLLIEEDERLAPMAVTIREYIEIIDSLKDRLESPEELFHVIQHMDLQRAKSAKRGTDKDLVEPVKYLRDLIKDRLKDMGDIYGMTYDGSFLEEMSNSYRHMKALSKLVLKFSEVFSEKKSAKNIIDFNDIEHFALKILVDDKGNASEVAESYQGQFTEILADEYQDTNLVQETLIQSVSTIHKGRPNVFMVGDIKQSIYKFRLAKPELFAEKYDAYSFDDSDYQKIELHKNFRSRKEVIQMTNYLFSQLMSKKVGDVTYDHHAALNQGASYEIESDVYASEIVLVDKAGSKRPTPEVEALQIAREIEGLMGQEPPMQVYDKALDGVRNLQYKDIVILLRTMTGWSETFVNVLKDHSIPVFSNTATGYFDTLEIQTILNALKIIDNPKQDIPLLSVLRSPMFKFTGDELVTLRLSERDVDYHSALMTYHESNFGGDALSNKTAMFVEQLGHWRHLRHELSIYELVHQVLEDTGYYDYTALMPGGLQRTGNLDMFISIVYKYEQSTYKGLFNFITYMENVKRQSVDYGEASLDEDSKDQVTIMSIHGSKGLEFPVVILGGLGKAFNKMDLRKSVLLNQRYGFGTDRVLVEERQRLASPTKEVIKKVMERELLSEELRILYVALTRAREKLIFVGTVNDLPKAVDKWAKQIRTKEIALDTVTVQSAGSFLDWVMYGLLRHNNARDLLKYADAIVPSSFELGEIAPSLSIREVVFEEGRLSEQSPSKIDVFLESSSINKEVMDQHLLWTYGYESLSKLHLSQSVSELKRLEAEEQTSYSGPPLEKVSYRPRFITGEQALTGAERGTVFHKVMDHIDFSLAPGEQNVEALMDQMVRDAVITEKEKNTVYGGGAEAFMASTLGLRVHQAALIGSAYKETPFVMGIPVNELSDSETDDFIMIQGVVDLHFEEGDHLILVDYKTDYAKDVPDQVFVERYHSQMTYYKRALEQQTGKEVKEIWLYVVGAKKAIEVPLNKK